MRFLMLFRIQLMYFQKLFTELKNIDSLLRYNLSKLAPIRTFFTRTSGNFSQKLRFSHFEILLFWLLLTLRIPFSAKLSDFIHYTNIMCFFYLAGVFWPRRRSTVWENAKKLLKNLKFCWNCYFLYVTGLTRPVRWKLWKIPNNICITYTT